ncbi:MAG TPA: hypothetical protein VFI68_04055 [Anaerolineales bacterium]|nr:hypothetical protein [Anaerolineales bacterium]
MKTDIFKKWSSYIILFILIFIIFSPVYYLNSYIKSSTDFPLHALYALDLKEKGIESLPAFTRAHSAWQYLLVFVNWISGFSFQKIGFLIAVFSLELTFLVLFLWFWPVFVNNKIAAWKRLVILLGICIAAPISMLWPIDHYMYLGYIGMTTYHSPTIILLKPFAFLQFILAYRCFDEFASLKKRQVFAAGVVSLIAVYVKPSLAICLLPALGIFAVYRMMQKRYVNLSGLFFGFALPSVLLLIWQFLVTYFDNEEGSIMFLPFGVMSAYSDYLILKLILSALFPLLILIVYYQRVKMDDRMILAWLLFGFGLFFTYFFAESGSRSMDGNFGWSGEISLVLLFVVSTLFYLELPKKQRWINFLIQASWVLQVVFGVAYYFYCIYNSTYI